MKYKKIDILCLVIGLIAYIGTLLGDLIDIETGAHIVLATTSIVFLMMGLYGIRHQEDK